MSDFDEEPKADVGNPDDDWDDAWDEEPRRGRDMTIVYAVVAAAIIIVLAVVLTRPSDDNSGSASSDGAPGATEPAGAPDKNWQGGVGDAVGENGAEAQARAQAAPGVYIWTDFTGFHVRSNGAEPIEVKVAGQQVRLKVSDDLDDSNEDPNQPFTTEVTATLPAGNGSTGAGIDIGFSELLTFTVTSNGQPVPAGEIFIGGAEAVADQNPVTFTKS